MVMPMGEWIEPSQTDYHAPTSGCMTLIVQPAVGNEGRCCYDRGVGADADMMRSIRTAALIAAAFFIALLVMYRFDLQMAVAVFGFAIGMAVMAPFLG
jgi:hypothetical protein